MEREIAAAQDSVVALRDLHKDALQQIAALNAQLYDHDKAAADEIAALKAERDEARLNALVLRTEVERMRKVREMELGVCAGHCEEVLQVASERDEQPRGNTIYQDKWMRAREENERLRGLLVDCEGKYSVELHRRIRAALAERQP